MKISTILVRVALFAAISFLLGKATVAGTDSYATPLQYTVDDGIDLKLWKGQILFLNQDYSFTANGDSYFQLADGQTIDSRFVISNISSDIHKHWDNQRWTASGVLSQGQWILVTGDINMTLTSAGESSIVISRDPFDVRASTMIGIIIFGILDAIVAFLCYNTRIPELNFHLKNEVEKRKNS